MHNPNGGNSNDKNRRMDIFAFAIYAVAPEVMLNDCRARVRDSWQKLPLVSSEEAALIRTIQQLPEAALNKPIDNASPDTYLHLAAKKKFFRLAFILLMKGADMDVEGASKLSPLSIATQNKDLLMVALLVAKNSKNPGPPLTIGSNHNLGSDTDTAEGLYEYLKTNPDSRDAIAKLFDQLNNAVGDTHLQHNNNNNDTAGRKRGREDDGADDPANQSQSVASTRGRKFQS